MPMDRVFLGLEKPALTSAVQWFFDKYGLPDAIDLDRVTIVVPGGRAGRRLLDLLLTEAESRGLALLPPKVVTAGTLPEELYHPKRPLADDLTQQLAWYAALRAMPAEELAPLVPHPPAADDLESWLPLADMLMRLHTELAADALDCADVAKQAAAVSGFNEQRRWRVLEKLQQNYLRTIDAAGLWDQQTARLVAIEHKECQAEGDVILLGTVDINQALRRMLDQCHCLTDADETTIPRAPANSVGQAVPPAPLDAAPPHCLTDADKPSSTQNHATRRRSSSDTPQITALVFAPADWSDRFDEHGCLKPAAWQELDLGVEDKQIRVADDPVDQADAVARAIAEYGGRYRADDLIIGVPDERVVPQLARQLDQCGLRARWGPGRSLSESGPYRLLAATAAYLERERFRPFAALVRHPDVERYVAACGVGVDYLVQLDEYYCEHLPSQLGDDWLGSQSTHDHLRSVHSAVSRMLEPLAGAEQRPGEWAEPLLEVLRTVYAGRELVKDNLHDAMTQKCLEALRDATAVLQSVPESVAPKISAPMAINWVLARVAKDALPPPPDVEAIELLGWLELPWDDGPALIVTSFNEGFVPEPSAADPFLPNRLRTELGLWDNARRYARDAYYLLVLRATRRDLALIVARRNADGDPLSPSRLLFAAPPEEAARRAARLFAEPTQRTARQPLAGPLTATRKRSGFIVRKPKSIVALAEPAESMKVTEFRDYLACPFRYYLRHKRKLEGIRDDADELDGGAFGSLVHDVLAALAQPDMATETKVERIEAFLLDVLEKKLRVRYGRHPLVPLGLQVAQLRHRLRALAAWQADWARDGWRIARAEVSADPEKAVFLVDGRGVRLRGRIDRIDVHEGGEEVAVLDYKSGATVLPPDRAHRKSDGRWVDLQLPLYRHLMKGLDLPGKLRLGYIAVPQDVNEVKAHLADWDEATLEDADEAAREVVRRIRNHEFWPPAPMRYGVPPDFAAICLEDVFDARLEDDADADEEPPSGDGGPQMTGGGGPTGQQAAPREPEADEGDVFRLDGSAPPLPTSRQPKMFRRARTSK